MNMKDLYNYFLFHKIKTHLGGHLRRYLFGPPYVNLLEPFPFLAGDQLVVPIGVTHISLPLHQIQSREREEKEQTNKRLELTQVQKESYVTPCACAD